MKKGLWRQAEGDLHFFPSLQCLVETKKHGNGFEQGI
jgi:hypothetical protein